MKFLLNHRPMTSHVPRQCRCFLVDLLHNHNQVEVDNQEEKQTEKTMSQARLVLIGKLVLLNRLDMG